MPDQTDGGARSRAVPSTGDSREVKRTGRRLRDDGVEGRMLALDVALSISEKKAALRAAGWRSERVERPRPEDWHPKATVTSERWFHPQHTVMPTGVSLAIAWGRHTSERTTRRPEQDERMTLTDAARRLIDAIDNEGVNPEFHRQQVARLRTEWPTLWRAIEEVRHAVT